MSRGTRAIPALVASVLTVPATAPAGAAIAAGILGALVLGDVDIGGHYNFRRS